MKKVSLTEYEIKVLMHHAYMCDLNQPLFFKWRDKKVDELMKKYGVETNGRQKF